MTNYAKRFSLAALTVAAIVVGLLSSTASHAATTNSLIKGSGATVYWNASNGKRYVFPNIKTFWSWYPTSMLDNVQKVSDSELASIPLGGNVTYRPGYKLIKVTTDPRVYAVSRYGILRWINNESVAQQLYGWDWASKIEDVPDAFFTNYTIGSPIYSTSDFNVSSEYNGVYNPSDSIVNAGSYNNNNNTNNGSNYNTNGQIGVSVSKVNVAENEYITVSANALNGTNATWIYVYDERTNTLLQTCNNATTCTFTDRVTRRNNTSSYRYYVTASVNGNWTTGYSNYLYINGGSNTTDGYGITATMNIGNTYLSNGLEYSTLQVNVNNPNNASGWSMNIVDQYNNVIKTCGTQSYCETTITLNPGETKTFYVNLTGSVVRDRITTVTRSYQNGNYNNNNNSYGIVTNTNLYATQNCNQNNVVSADITVNGPTTVTYIWERDNSTYSTIKTLYFANAGTQTVTETLYANGSQSNAMRIRVTSPNSYTSNPVTINACNNNNNQGSASVTVNTDKTTVFSGQQVTISTYVNNSSFATQSLITKIYDERNGNLLAQCNASLNCNTSLMMSAVPGLSNTTRFQAVVTDTFGNTVASGYSQYVTIQ